MATDIGGSVVDSILYNLIATKQLYEFEIQQVSTLIDLIAKLHREKKEEIAFESKYFDTAFEVERKALIASVKKLQEKVTKLDNEIQEKQQAKNKLNSLFEMLGQLNEKERQLNTKEATDLDSDLGIFEIREELDDDDNIIKSTVGPYANGVGPVEAPAKNITNSKMASDLPMGKKEIRKRTDDLQSRQDTKSIKEVDDFEPIMIREELDDEENIISGKLTKPLVPQADQTPEIGVQDPVENDVDEDQIAELLADMGLKEPEVPKLEEITEPAQETNTMESTTQPTEDTSVSSMSAISLGGSIAQDDLLTLELIADELDQENDENAPDFADDEEWDIIDDDEEDNDGDEDFDDDDDDDDDDDEDDGSNFVKGMIPGRANNLFMSQLQSLRSGKPVKDLSPSTLPIDEALTPKAASTIKKSKKSVSFANEVAVKEIENVWEEMNENSSKDIKISAFKRRVSENSPMVSNTVIDQSYKDNESSNEVLFDLTDRVLDNSAEPVPFIAPKQQTTTSIASSHSYPISRRKAAMVDTSEKSLNLSKLSKFKYKRQLNAAAPSIFKRESDASSVVEKPVSPVIQESNPEEKNIFGKEFSSLKPQKAVFNKIKPQQHSVKIIPPKESNPEVPNAEFIAERESGIPYIVNEEADFEEIEDETQLDSGEPSGRSEIVSTQTKNIKSSQPSDNIEVVGTTLDYNSLQDNMDTMAKAYILGLYDDDIQTEGEVIEQLEDFERMNKIVESRQAKKTLFQEFGENTTSINMDADEGLDAIPKEIDDDEDEADNNEDEDDEDEDDNGPVLASEIVEHIDHPSDNVELDPEVSSVSFSIPDPDLDIPLSSDVLNQNIALDYTRLRKKLMGQYNGGFKKSLKELELEPIDEFGNEVKVSRFKAAKLAMRNPKDFV